MRTWADWDGKAPGFVEIDLVGHEGGDSRGEFAQTVTVTDVFTGLTETKAVRNHVKGLTIGDGFDDAVTWCYLCSKARWKWAFASTIPDLLN